MLRMVQAILMVVISQPFLTACFVELGLRVPRNGGIQEYLRAATRGDLAPFLFAWNWLLVTKPAASAAVPASIHAVRVVRVEAGIALPLSH